MGSSRPAVALLGCALLTVMAGCAMHATHRADPPSPVHSTSSRPVPPAAHTPAASTSSRPAPSAPTSPAPWSPCTANTAAQLVYVSVAHQQLWMCAGHTLVTETPVTTGATVDGTDTPTGTYEIQGKFTDQTLTLRSGAQYQVKYWITFDAPLFGFHDSSWQHFPYGSQQYKTDGSHGCVHMPLDAIAKMYTWADVGAKVVITAT